ncbi:MAG: hypothetical protein ABF242_05005 [Flavobacteriales bacterium]
MNKIAQFTFLISIVLVSCKKEVAEKAPEPEVPEPLVVRFATDVQPIFQANCGTGNVCHGTINAERGYIFETHAGAEAASSAKIIGSINHQSGFSNMPRTGPKLSQDKIDIIEAWINGGKLND